MANTNDCWFAKPNPEKIGPDESHIQRTSVSPSFQEGSTSLAWWHQPGRVLGYSLMKCTWRKLCPSEQVKDQHLLSLPQPPSPRPCLSLETALSRLLWPGPGGWWHRPALLLTSERKRTWANNKAALLVVTELPVSRMINCYRYCGHHFLMLQSVIKTCQSGLGQTLRDVYVLSTPGGRLNEQPFTFPAKQRPEHFS